MGERYRACARESDGASKSRFFDGRLFFLSPFRGPVSTQTFPLSLPFHRQIIRQLLTSKLNRRLGGAQGARMSGVIVAADIKLAGVGTIVGENVFVVVVLACWASWLALGTRVGALLEESLDDVAPLGARGGRMREGGREGVRGGGRETRAEGFFSSFLRRGPEEKKKSCWE